MKNKLEHASQQPQLPLLPLKGKGCRPESFMNRTVRLEVQKSSVSATTAPTAEGGDPMPARPKIVIMEDELKGTSYEEEILRPLSPKFIVCTFDQDDEGISSLIHDADAVLNSAVELDSKVIDRMGRCRVIANYGRGSVDEAAAQAKGINVTRISDYSPTEVAEHVLALCLTFQRKILALDAHARNGTAYDSSRQPIRGMKGLRIGVLGNRDIAREFSNMVFGLGAEVAATGEKSAQLPADVNLRYVERETLLRESDVLAILALSSESAVHQLGETEFLQMQPGAVLINVSGPGYVDEESLNRALTQGLLSGAVLDASSLSDSPTAQSLRKSPHVLLTPPMDWLSHESNKLQRESAAREVLRILKDGPATHTPAPTVLACTDTKTQAIPLSLPEAPKSPNGAGGSKATAKRRITAADYLVRYLDSMGVRHIFGVVGGTIAPFYVSLNNSPIQDVLTKHEGGAAFMADGYARVSGQLGVCAATTGPGTTNLITGVASAFADSIPMLVISGQVSTEYFGRGASQESSPEGMDTVQMYKQFTRYSGLVFKGNKVPDYTRKAMTHALHGRSGPVHLALPNDVLRESFDETPDIWNRPNPPSAYFDRDAIRQAATWLLRAKHPAILVGHGCVLANACEEMKRLAESLRIPVATTPKAKGALPEDHLLSLGVFGFSGSPLAQWYLLSGRVDVMLAVGTSFSEWGTLSWKKELMPSRALLHINIDPRDIGRNYPATVSLCGDAQTVLRELFFEMQRQRKWYTPYQNGFFDELTEARTRVGMVRDPGAMTSDATPLKPQRVMADLRASLPHDALVFVDGGANRSWATHYYQAIAPRTFFSATGMASMGFGVAGAIGGKFAAPDRVVVSIVGDGGFLMNGMEVSTAVAHGKQVIWVVLNDGQHGMIYHGNQMMGYPVNSTRYPICDIAKIAEGLGARGLYIREPGQLNRRLIQDILENGEPTVLDVRTDPEEAPPIGGRVASIRKGATEFQAG